MSGSRAAWDESPEALRAAMLAHARGAIQAACDAQGSTVVRQPAVDVAAATRAKDRLVVTFCSSFRVSCLAQSGSDWGEQTLWVTETTFGPAAEVVAERVLHRDFISIAERDEPDHDDAAAMREVVDEVLRAELRRALDDAAFRETLATSAGPVAVFLARAGAFLEPTREEIEYTDWDGTPVGRGPGPVLREAIAPDPALPFAELAPLLELGVFARRLVARHPATPPEVLLALAADDDEGVQNVVAGRVPHDEAIRLRLAKSRFRDVRRQIARDPAVPRDCLTALARDPDSAVRYAVAERRDLDDALLAELALDQNPRIMTAVIAHPKVTVEQLARFAEESAESVALAVASHPRAPGRALARIAARELTPRLRIALAQRAATPPDVLERLLADPKARVYVAANRSLPRALAVACARDVDKDVREALARNASVDEALLAGLIEDEDASVRCALAQNPRFSNLADLATDPNMTVRQAVAGRADAPQEVLDALAHDNQTLVRRAVAETLAKRAK